MLLVTRENCLRSYIMKEVFRFDMNTTKNKKINENYIIIHTISLINENTLKKLKVIIMN